MSRFAFCLLAFLIAAGPGPVRAQYTPIPSPPYFAVNPPSGVTPLQQQQIRNYRSRLLQTQRELRRQNPAGLSRDQIEIARQLNAFDPRLNPVPQIAPPVMTAPPVPPGPVPFQ